MIANLPDGLKESGAIEVRKKLGTISGGDILDVGTEDGDFINTLMKTLLDYNSFTGIDISEDELKKAREQLKDAPVIFKIMNAEMMTFQDNQFDTVCASYAIHHLENIDTVLTEMYRVLKPGGNFIIQEMYSDGEQTTAQRVDRDVHNLNAKIDSILGTPHFEALTRQRLKSSINEVGLSAVEIYESSWAVNCLFCKDAHDCEKPRRTDHVDFVTKEIDDDLTRILDHPSYDKLKIEGESLKERVKVTGSSASSLMYFFGKK